MQLLASALPGFRDLRAPLTAGYLWLLLLWIVLRPDLTSRPINEIAGSVWDLARAAGPLWISLAVGVAAYLIGSVSQVFSPSIFRLAHFIYRSRWAMSSMAGLGNGQRTLRDDAVFRYRNRALRKLGISLDIEDGSVLAGRQAVEYRQLEEQLESAGRKIQSELELPATLLIGKEPELFTEADRLKAESQLRLAVCLPLTFIIMYVSAHISSALLILLIPVIIIWFQGHRRELEFQSLMMTALEQDLARSRTLEDLKEWIDNLPTIRN